MSQQKVDRYRKYKSSKEKALRREKISEKLEFAAVILVLVLLAVWFVWSCYQKWEEAQPEVRNTYTIVNSSVDDYINNLSSSDSSSDEDSTGESASDESTSDESASSDSSSDESADADASAATTDDTSSAETGTDGAE